MIEDFTADRGSLGGKVQSMHGFGGFVKTAVSTGTIRDSTSSLTTVLIILVNMLGAAALLLPAIWTAYSVSDMSGSGRGYTDLDNAIRAEENLKVGISLALFIAIALFFLALNGIILAVRKQLRNVKTWMTASMVLVLPSALLFGYLMITNP